MTSSATADSYVLFVVAGTSYAVRSDDVRHMEMIDQITPVPNAAPYLEGVVLSRGEIVPVLNLRVRFGFDKAPHDLRSRLVVVQAGDRRVGLLADSAREFVSIPAAAIEPPSHAITGLSADYLAGIATIDGRLILVLNIANVLGTSEMTSTDDGPGGARPNTSGRGRTSTPTAHAGDY